jgi:endonuclease/exonuclease/phosphatase family metal-dependent hydrolase
MAITVAAWNLKEGLALPGQAPSLIEGIKCLDADVVALSDAYWLDNPLHGADADIFQESLSQLKSEGYSAQAVEYGNYEMWPRRYMLALGRLSTQTVGQIGLGTRNALDIRVGRAGSSAEMRIISPHLDDRQENNRNSQAQALISQLSPGEANVVIGDFNSLYRGDLWPTIVRHTIGKIIDHERPVTVTEYIDQGKLARANSLARRLAEIADGGNALEVFARVGLSDADPMHRPSFPARLPLLHLDRCFLSSEVRLDEFSVMPFMRGSDHRAIKARLST